MILDLDEIRTLAIDWSKEVREDVNISVKNALKEKLASQSDHYVHIKNINNGSETNDCLLRLVPLAIWASRLESSDQLFYAVRLYCGITHLHELVIESCYLYCYAIKQLIVTGCSKTEAYYKT
jgi:ADP-ribosylglycohydrolase